MSIGLIGKKIGMRQVFEESGDVAVSTVIHAGSCKVIQKKTGDIDGYEAVQLGFDEKKRNVKKPLLGHFKRWNTEPKKIVREFKVESSAEYQPGEEIGVDVFKSGDFVDVMGVSKGKGFTGVMKRWGFSGGPGSHGAHKWNRRPGSIGSSATPSRVFRGMKMAGHAGARKVSVQNLKVLRVDRENGLIFVKGAVAGDNGGYLIIRKAKKKA